VNELDTAQTAKKPLISTIISMMVSPAKALKSSVAKVPWYFSVAVSALAFGLFFFQTGFDLYKTGQKGFSFALFSAGAGIAYGLIIIPLLGGILWLIMKLVKTEKSISWAISSFCLSYSGAMIYGVLGILFSVVLGWKTAVAFGITGVLWATGPIIATIREMTKEKSALGIVLATIIGAIILFSWSLFAAL
jgi:hypothetical protein